MAEDNSSTQGGGDGSPDGTSPSAEDVSGLKSALSKERQARKDAEGRVSELEERLQELEDRDKNDVERITQQLEDEKAKRQRAEQENLRLKVASRKGLTAQQAERLQGDDEESLEEDADQLLEMFGASNGDDGDGEADGGQTVASAAGDGRPTEKLKPGASNAEEPEQSPKEVADEVQRRVRGL